VRNHRRSYWHRATPSSAWKTILILALATLIAALVGCAKKPEVTPETPRITQEMAAAARQAGDERAGVTIHSEMQPAPNGQRTTLETDHIVIKLENAAARARIERALDAVALKYGLAKFGGGQAATDRWVYGMHDHPTEVIHLILPGTTAAAPPAIPLPAAPAQTPTLSETPATEPKLAVIIDDMGNDKQDAESVFALHVPLTISVLPYRDFSTHTADEAYRRGFGVMLHMPMMPEPTKAKQEDIELRPGMTSVQVKEMVSAMLDAVPHATGVNNHEGSLATSNAALMEELMPMLKERRLFFVDSRTAITTVAYDTAKRAGVKAAWRKVFLDDTPTKPAVLAQLAVAEKDARKDGWAIAIGHPHPETIAALAEALPELHEQGIRLVLASDLVQ
jgi:polysaccharide deacetylase 2 family uncharacterized protein YibQ